MITWRRESHTLELPSYNDVASNNDDNDNNQLNNELETDDSNTLKGTARSGVKGDNVASDQLQNDSNEQIQMAARSSSSSTRRVARAVPPHASQSGDDATTVTLDEFFHNPARKEPTKLDRVKAHRAGSTGK